MRCNISFGEDTDRGKGPVPSVFFGGCMTLLVVVVTWFKAPALKNMEYYPLVGVFTDQLQHLRCNISFGEDTDRGEKREMEKIMFSFSTSWKGVLKPSVYFFGTNLINSIWLQWRRTLVQ